jgi:nicotinate phosphoribosyltransferase
MAFEIYVLAIVNELYFRRFDQAGGSCRGRAPPGGQGRSHAARGEGELDRRHPFEFFDFGMRRRYSGELAAMRWWPPAREVPRYFKGTSNVLLARDLGLVPDRHHGARVPADLTRRWACGCATSRRPRSRPGCRSTAATWASR